MWADVATVLALIMVFEGLLYAMFPCKMKEFMLRLGTYSGSGIRKVGLLAASFGVLLVWLIRG